MPSPDDARLAALEQAVAALREEVAELRASRAAPAPPAPVAPAPVAPPIAPPAPTYASFAAAQAAGFPDARQRHGPPPRGMTSARTAARQWLTGLGVPDLPTEGGFETLVGRYGAVAVGALVLLMGVGAFLTWAVENFTLTPTARVALGALGAAALAALGEWLRRRPGAERFGEVLLALALAVVHVDAWAAGPYLRLVSAETALGVAAATSLALTALAWRTRQQSLFVVGVGGALLAPFVSGAAEAHPLVRPIYGWVVLTAGLAALDRGSDPRRPWRAAARLLGLGVGSYAVAQVGASKIGAPPSAATWMMASGAARAASPWTLAHVAARDSAPAFALACAAGPLALVLWRALRHQRYTIGPENGESDDATTALLVRLALAYLVTTTFVLWAVAGAAPTRALSLVALALATVVAAQLIAALPATAGPALADDVHRPRWARRRVPLVVLAALLIPLTTLGAAIAAYGNTDGPEAAGIAALWAALSAGAALWAWRRSDATHIDPRLGPHLASAGFGGALALVVWSHHHDPIRVALLGLYGAITALVFGQSPGRATTPGMNHDARPLLALATPLTVLVGAAAWGGALLHDRPAFTYLPFLTVPSASMAVVTLGWCVCAALVWRSGNDLLPRAERAAVVSIAVAVALLWGREELARVGAPDVSTFLLVGYWALAGVALIAFGRARQVAGARQAGLALALFAALKAIVEVSQLDAVALRVGSYLLVGGFLLGVGYWYRAAGGVAPRGEELAPPEGRTTGGPIVRPAP